MNSGGDNWWVQENAAKIVSNRGFSSAAVEAVHRFFNGQVTPQEYMSTWLKFARAYFYRIDLLGMAREMVVGPRLKLRPEATIFGYRHVVAGWSVMDRLREIHVPTLVVAGRYDFLFPPEHQAILADRLPNAQLVLVERAGHNPHMERTAEVVQVIRNFLAGEPRA
jgi:proline iminopeptidase